MVLLSLQILLINFLISAAVTFLMYLLFKKSRKVNVFILFLVSSLGSFTGTSLGHLLPFLSSSSENLYIQNLFMAIPGVLFSVLFLSICIRGSRSESFF